MGSVCVCGAFCLWNRSKRFYDRIVSFIIILFDDVICFLNQFPIRFILSDTVISSNLLKDWLLFPPNLSFCGAVSLTFWRNSRCMCSSLELWGSNARRTHCLLLYLHHTWRRVRVREIEIECASHVIIVPILISAKWWWRWQRLIAKNVIICTCLIVSLFYNFGNILLILSTAGSGSSVKMMVAHWANCIYRQIPANKLINPNDAYVDITYGLFMKHKSEYSYRSIEFANNRLLAPKLFIDPLPWHIDDIMH